MAKKTKIMPDMLKNQSVKFISKVKKYLDMYNFSEKKFGFKRVRYFEAMT